MPQQAISTGTPPQVYEIHGNANYMHCSDESQPHSQTILEMPSLDEFSAAREANPDKVVDVDGKE